MDPITPLITFCIYKTIKAVCEYNYEQNKKKCIKDNDNKKKPSSPAK